MSSVNGQHAMNGAKVEPANEETSVDSPSNLPELSTTLAVEVNSEERKATVVMPDHESDETEGNDEDPPETEQISEEDMLADYADDTEDLELVHLRISTLTSLNLPRFGQYLKRLCLRQNFISHLDPNDFHPLTELEELDFYDNKLKHVGIALENMTKLRVLDLSFNLIKHIPEVIPSLKSLETVYFVQNKISAIQNLQDCGEALRSLELGGNRIRTIENLDALLNLQELWLGKNKITKLENLGFLKRLRILSIQSNRITRIEGLEELRELEELYLSHNGLGKLEGLERNLKLKTLDVGNNGIQILENLSHLTNLEELWINDNAIPNLNDITPQLGHLKNLQTVYLEGNPCQRSDMVNYRRKLILALPQVSQIDATFVKV